MNKLTYVEARDKIWNAYFRDEIKPWDAKFCFCGNLNEREGYWGVIGLDSRLLYSRKEYLIMEQKLLSPLPPEDDDPEYEESLFQGMLAALEVLKQIHRERGEVIPEDEPLLTKRTLQTQTI